MVVLHFTAMADPGASRAWLCNSQAEVSAHYQIDPDGAVWRLVPEALRAWHAGAGAWGPVVDVNSRSIGIELANTGRTPFAAPQMDALEALLPGIMARWDVPPERVIGHSDMALRRKVDPGRRFDWRRLARGGMAVWPDGGVSAEPTDFAGAAARIGYVQGDDLAPEDVLEAFRQRFRPWAPSGAALDAVDAGLAAEVAVRWPVAGD
ncbi:MAG: N-acetylmuramoyl-L-alanine amidase [Celeribacter sp.]|jgi:N-acetylmuramoyl-L-alanine amidase